MPSIVRGSFRTRPTYALALPAARAAATLPDLIALVLRAHRRSLALSQRSYAASRGWSKSHQARLESGAGQLRLEVVESALVGTGFHLTLARGPRREAASVAVAPAQMIGAQDFPGDEWVARDRAGRRFPAHRRVRRTAHAPLWWAFRYATSRSDSPEWTSARW